jgi:uncharacterized protein YaiI (UPF0178 family)
VVYDDAGKEFVVRDGRPGKKYDAVYGPFFSPDSQRVAYVARTGEKRCVVVNDSEGAPYDLIYCHQSVGLFGPVAGRLAYPARKGSQELVVVEALEGQLYDWVSERLTFSPNGQRVAYCAGRRAKELVVVDGQFDAADDWIVEHVRPQDIVISGDIPLASRCLEKGALVLGPTGRVFTEENIGDALASRELLSHLRELGTMTGGPVPFEKRDRSRFLQRLDEMVRAALRKE